jgi:quercetin dioxygenase-like cupin family protein
MLVLISLFLSAAEPSVQPSAQPIQIDASSVVWKDAPTTMPKGTQMAVLEGDPSKEGMFTLRLKAPKGFALMLHTHPAHERVTVLEGSINVGFDLGLDKKSARTFKAGAFYVNPPGVPHFVYSDEGCIVQITGIGPWKVEMAQTVPTSSKK